MLLLVRQVVADASGSAHHHHIVVVVGRPLMCHPQHESVPESVQVILYATVGDWDAGMPKQQGLTAMQGTTEASLRSLKQVDRQKHKCCGSPLPLTWLASMYAFQGRMIITRCSVVALPVLSWEAWRLKTALSCTYVKGLVGTPAQAHQSIRYVDAHLIILAGTSWAGWVQAHHASARGPLGGSLHT